MKIQNNKVKIGARISYRLYFMFKYVCMTQGVTMESKIEALLEKDMKATLKKSWFQDHLIELEKTEPEAFTMFKTLMNGAKASECESSEESE